MAAAVQLWILSVWVFGLVSAHEKKNITAKLGDTITLPCDAVRYKPIYVAEWSRTDQEQLKIILIQNGGTNLQIKDQSYEGRVALTDKDRGDVSLILKNVTVADTGTYECRVQTRTNRKKRNVENHFISTVNLQVSPPGPPDPGPPDPGPPDGGGQDGHQDVSSGGSSGLIVGLVVLAVIVVLMIPAVIIVIVRRRLTLYHPPPHNEAEKPAPL